MVDTVMMNCVTTLNTHFDLHGEPDQVPNLAEGLKRETRRGQVDSMREAKNVIFCLDYSGSMAGERIDRYVVVMGWPRLFLLERSCLLYLLFRLSPESILTINFFCTLILSSEPT